MDLIPHLVLALTIQALIFLLCRSWLAGATAAIAWAISREITQAEYRWIEAYGGGLRANMPWWGGLDMRVWQKVDAWLDWTLPSLLVLAVALGAMRSSRDRS
jgi:hypothetical protein